MNPVKRAAGWSARRNGQCFENLFENHCRIEGVTCIRIPDGCRVVGRNTILRVATPFDYIIGYEGKTAFLDLKTYDSRRLSFSQITKHQLENLLKLRQHSPSGYLVWFRDVDSVVFFDAHSMVKLKARESLGPEDGLVIGTIKDMAVRSVLT